MSVHNEKQKPSRLNLGCGTDIRPGWINVDSVTIAGVDVVHDLEKLPLPFESGSMDTIACKDVLEHLDYLPIMKELYRLLKPGGRLEIQVPHFTSKDAFSDPTHVRLFSANTFSYFLRAHPRNYYFDYGFSSIERLCIHFQLRPAYPWNYLMQPCVNLSDSFRNFYEGSPLRVFPATNIEVVLVK